MKNNRKLRCLHVTTIDLTADCFLKTWFAYLIEKGFDVTLATTAGEFRERIEETGTRVVHIPMARNMNPVSDLVSLIRLYYFIKQEGFDSIQTYTTKAGFIGRLAGKLAGVPVIIHNVLELPENSARNPILKFFYRKMEQIAGRWADLIITITSANVNQILKNGITVRERLIQAPEGLVAEKYDRVKIDRQAKRKEMGVPDGSILIGNVGRLESAKGQTYLLSSARIILENIPDAFFMIVGRGRLMDSLKRKAESLGISHRVLFTGFREDLLEILQTFDIFLFPSLWEGQGVAPMEAMMYEIPVVASAVGGVTDVVIHGETGILIPPEDPEAMANAVVELLRDPEKMARLGKAGRQRILTEFDDGKCNDLRYSAYIKAYKEKLGIDLP